MNQDNFPIARQRDILVQSAQDEVLVYDLKTNKALCLNETSATIWQLCNGKNDIADIAKQFQTQSNQQIPVEFIEVALEQLNREKLIKNYQPRTLTNKKSRREMIRKVGLATAVALPIVTSLIAPSAIHAASCASGLTFCPARTPFGFNLPAGCFDLQNGAPVPGVPGAIECGNFCGGFCFGSFTCVGGVCTMV